MPTYHAGTAVSVTGDCNACCGTSVACCDGDPVSLASTLYLTLGSPEVGDPAGFFGVALPLEATLDLSVVGGISWQLVNYASGGYYLWVRWFPCGGGIPDTGDLQVAYGNAPFPWSGLDPLKNSVFHLTDDTGSGIGFCSGHVNFSGGANLYAWTGVLTE